LKKLGVAPDTGISMLLPTPLVATELRRRINPDSLGFSSTAELLPLSGDWIGQQRAQAAARFGLAMRAPDYHLFVIGEPASGRSSLLRQAMQEVAAQRDAPPDLAYLHNFDQPNAPQALRLPAGVAQRLKQALLKLTRHWPQDIAHRLESADVSLDIEHIERQHRHDEKQTLAQLEDLATRHGLRLSRDKGKLRLLPREDRKPGVDAQAAHSDPALRREMAQWLNQLRDLEHARDTALQQLRRQRVQAVLEQGFAQVLDALPPHSRPALQDWIRRAERELLDQLDLFTPQEVDDEGRRADLDLWLDCLRLNVVVDHSQQAGAPVLCDNNPQLRSLFGSIEHPAGEDAGPPDHHAIHAGALLQAHGGFLMLHLQDLLDDEPLWERLRRFLRSRQLQIEEPGGSGSPAGASLQPEPVAVDVKLVLIGSPDDYYKLQEDDPEMARRFRVKVDFAERFEANMDNYRAMAHWMSQRCKDLGLPAFNAAAVAALLEQSHREADDQHYLSAQFGQLQALMLESAECARLQEATSVRAQDVIEALAQRRLRHGYPERCVQDAIAEGERLLSLSGQEVGQVNAMSQVDTGDHRFGAPMRISARAQAGVQGLLNIEREVKLSGPIHDKGLLILQSHLNALFGQLAPLSLAASVVFEQEYDGVEGDSASCAEFYALMSALSGLPLAQGIAVTGALSQHGEVLPVGGLNEKIEGWFGACQRAGLDGHQGVLIPRRNARQLMLSPELLAAVERSQFRVYTMDHVGEGMALLTGVAYGDERSDLHTVLGRARQTLVAYRRAMQTAARGA
jgi:predicted ATP-dependent protease